MHRFFVPPQAVRQNEVHFSAAQAHQVRDVLRLRAGAEVLVLDNSGLAYRVSLNYLARNEIRGEVLETQSALGEPQTNIVLYQALLKVDKFEWVLQKGTELGVSTFVPIVTERSLRDVGKNKAARWSEIVREAAEQSGRGKLPVLASHQSLTNALASGEKQGGLLLVPWEQEKTNDLAKALGASDGSLVHLFIGPEGGFADHEIQSARATGAQIITLGPRILRAETAGLAACSAIFFARGDLARS
jgi:16S rRNA (uracil1498-N3)-methyltransferase